MLHAVCSCFTRCHFSLSATLNMWNENGTVNTGYTYPTQATACLVIVLLRRMQKSGIGETNWQIVKWKGTWSNRLKWVDQSEWTSFKGGPKYSGRTGPKMVRSISLIISNRNFQNFGLNRKRSVSPISCKSKLIDTQLKFSFHFIHNAGTA